MKITEALKAELAQWLDTYWKTYIKGDFDLWSTFITEDYYNIGGTKEEIWHSKQEILDYSHAIFDQMVGQAEIRNREIEVLPYGDYVMVNEFTDLYVKIEGEWTYYGPFRMSSLLSKTDTGWIALHQHGSYPDMKATEGEAFAADALKAENKRLQEAVDQRTSELTVKNRELEIEASLEKVRSRSLAMQKSEELAEASVLLEAEIRKLGIENWGCAFHIYDEKTTSETPWDLEWFTSAAGILPFYKTPREEIFLKYYEESKKGNPLYIQEFGPEVIKEHYDYLKTIPVLGDALTELYNSGVPLPERQIDHIAFFDHGHLLFITYKPLPEAHAIFIRFANVFNQAYTRFLDLQKAEAQAREAEIELALERVRSRSLAMHATSELQDVIHTVHQELLKLDIGILGGSFIVINSEIEEELHCWGSGGTADTSDEVHIPYFDKPFYTNLVKGLKGGPAFFTEEFTQEEKKEFFTFLFTKEPWSNLKANEKKEILSSPGGYTRSCSVSLHTSIFIINQLGNKFSEEENDILKRFGKVFEQSYTRFLDLQKAEAQAREAQIEVAIERVRAQSMAMHHPDDLDKVNKEILSQLKWLQIKGLTGVTFYLIDEKGWVKAWDFSSPGNTADQSSYTLQFDSNKHEMLGFPFKTLLQTDLDYFVADYPLEKLEKAVYEFEEIDPAIAKIVREALSTGMLTHQWTSCCRISNGLLGIDLVSPPSEDTKAIVLKMASAFNQAYTRFLDLQKAEAQAREAEIELALERVRSRSIAMHRSEEIADIAGKIFTELSQLDLVLNRVLIWTFNDPKEYITWWSANPEEASNAESYQVDYNDQPVFLSYFKAWKERKTLHFLTLSGENKKTWEDHLFEKTELSRLPLAVKKGMREETAIFTTSVIGDYGLMMVGSYEPLPESSIDIIQRFGRVFQQSYTRYLDVQKAEAQAREAQVEAALERVRSRTIGMQHSEELQEATAEMFQQIASLHVNLMGCGFNLWDDDQKFATSWMSGMNGIQPPFKTDSSKDIFLRIFQAQQKDESLFVEEQTGDELQVHYEYMASIPTFKKILDGLAEKGLSVPSFQIMHCAFFAQGYLMFITHEPSPETYDIFRRFAKVFEQTYTRFLDLQKAEEQAREAEIELALERVRARTLAMKSSEELADAAFILFEQLRGLGGTLWGTGFGLCQENAEKDEFWFANENGVFPSVSIPNTTDPAHNRMYKGWQEKTDFLSIEKSGKALKNHYEYMLSLPEVRPFFQKIIDEGLSFPERQQWNAAYFSKGYLLIITLEPYEEADILKRFAKVFEQTYTRFLDLQKAEAQAREAMIEAALERVRSQAMAMRHSDDLANCTRIVFDQLENLNLSIERSGIGIFDPETKGCQLWTIVVNQYGVKELTKGITSLTIHPLLISTFDSWLAQKPYSYILEGKELADYYALVASSKFVLSTEVMEKSTSLSKEYYHYSPFSAGGVYFFSDSEPIEEDKQIIRRLAEVFDLTYTRFLDLQKAEAQARESEIQLALERVRARTMAMQKSEELADVAFILFEQLRSLGGNLWGTGFGLCEENTEKDEFWFANENGVFPPVVIPNTTDPAHKQMRKGWQEKVDFLSIEKSGKALKDHYDYMRSLPEVRPFFQKIIDEGLSFPENQEWNAAYFSKGYLLIITLEPYPDKEILKRFGKVFEQTYTRFLDLQKAEARARESQIEAALERVRSRTMGMQHSSELTSAATLLFQQIQTLGVPPWSCGFNIWEQGDSVFTSYMGGGSENFLLEGFKIPLTEEAAFIHFQESRDRGDKLFVDVLEGEALEAHYRYFFTLPGIKEVFENAAQEGLPLPTFQINHLANFKHGNLMFITYEPCPEAHDIFIRFANVFEQTYTRFLDLQKSEDQAREAQVEAALERVRSRTMAMQNSSELAETSIEMFKQMQALGMRPWACGFNIFEKDEKAITQWMAAADGGLLTPFTTPLTEDPFFIRISEARQRGEELFVMESGGQELEETYKYMFSLPGSQKALAGIMAAGFEMPKFQISHCAFFSQGYLLFITYEPYPEAYDVFKRFAKVFEQTYTRFLDLQKAEAQAREAQIETALEKVRSRTMAMQKSQELAEVSLTLFEQVEQLGIKTWSTGFNVWLEDDTSYIDWVVNSASGKFIEPYKVDLTAHPSFLEISSAKKQGDDFFVHETEGETLEELYRLLSQMAKTQFEDIVKAGFQLPEHQINHYVFGSKVSLMFITFDPCPEAHDIFKRFGKVFEQTYTRFLDLQKAEARARESQIETALERVRSRTMGMQQSEELGDVATVLFNEMNGLVSNLWTCGFVLCEENRKEDEWWLSMDTGFTRGFYLPNVGDFAHASLYEGWQKGEALRSVVLEGDALSEHYNWLVSLPVAKQLFDEMDEKGIERPTWQKLHAAYFKTGYLVIITAVPCAEEEIFKRFAQVFDLTYTRFLDLQQKEEQGKKLVEEKLRLERTLKDLQATQAQLIQSEKMASLGELTAGIAHEIQNPLNFVNNFSEVSSEMFDELMEEIEKGDMEEVKAISADIKENLIKINHHGKRADSIVKGMLEHSRSSSGEKSLTDINALADEFLRLSYHGIRAKDKSFNSDFKLELDPLVPKINIIGKDIGRVILNLVNNAFYAVNEKAKTTPQPSRNIGTGSKGGEGFEPTVIVKTKAIKSPSGDLGVELSVKDNGNGIPDSVKDKIFQPFFTTKPTGSGTGLGLSLSYDIVKAHGGELKVESIIGSGTIFSIILTTGK